MGKAGNQAAKQVENKISDRPKPVFNVISKDIEKPHVSQEMPEAPVNEHEGEEGKYLLGRGKIGADFRYGIPHGN